MDRQITKDGVIVIDEEEINGEELVSIMRSRDTYAGWKRDGDKRIAELEAAIARALRAVNAGLGSRQLEKIEDARAILREALGS